MTHSALPAYQVTSADAPMSKEEASAYTVGVAGFLHGMAPSPRASLPGYDSGILSIIIAAVLLVSVNARHAKALMGRLGRDLWSVRRRANVFDDNTVGESGVTLSMILLTCVCEGTLVFSWLRMSGVSSPWPGASPFALMPVAVGFALLLYFFQLAAYDVAGFTFTDKTGRQQWIRGFNASQSVMAVAMLVPALCGLFYPAYAMQTCAIGAALYVAARLVFIIKGFRIFHTGFSSLLVFILYLCTLEIAPVVLAVRLCNLPS